MCSAKSVTVLDFIGFALSYTGTSELMDLLGRQQVGRPPLVLSMFKGIRMAILARRHERWNARAVTSEMSEITSNVSSLVV